MITAAFISGLLIGAGIALAAPPAARCIMREKQRQVGYRVVAQPRGVTLWQSNGGAPTHSATTPEVARLTDGRHGSGAMQRR